MLVQKRNPVRKVFVAVGRDGQRQLARELQRLELLRGQKVVLEVFELARADNPDVAGTQRVLELRHRAQLLVPPIDAGRGDHQLCPALLHEGDGRVRRHLASIVGVERSQHVDRIEHVLRCRRRSQLQDR